MTVELLSLIALLLAALPCGLFLLNLLAYRRLRSAVEQEHSTLPLAPPKLCVLIPARNEEANIGETLDSVLKNRGVEFEVIVLDDQSTDRTAAIVAKVSEQDSRVRLEAAPRLPSGWCGKQHACHVLASLARHPLLVFMDADVRLSPDALSRIGMYMEESHVDLASGVPRQILGTFSERLLLPLIHFILLGFLPMHWARRSKSPAFAAGCGQLFVARAEAYHRMGGHFSIRTSLHDGIKLPRAFRIAGFRTALFDATDLAICRMYHKDGEVWRGLGKNATEGLAARGTIGPMSALLLGGQVLPFLLLCLPPTMSTTASAVSVLAVLLALIPRLVGAWRFRQPILSAFLQPFGILALLAIQWGALFRSVSGRPSVWKGRTYGAPSYPLVGATGRTGR